MAVPIDECGTADAHVDAVVDKDWRLDIRNRAKTREKIYMAITWNSCIISCRIE